MDEIIHQYKEHKNNLINFCTTALTKLYEKHEVLKNFTLRLEYSKYELQYHERCELQDMNITVDDVERYISNANASCKKKNYNLEIAKINGIPIDEFKPRQTLNEIEIKLMENEISYLGKQINLIQSNPELNKRSVINPMKDKLQSLKNIVSKNKVAEETNNLKDCIDDINKFIDVFQDEIILHKVKFGRLVKIFVQNEGSYQDIEF